MTETLYQKLQRATSEEDVKDIYIKALGLKNVYRNIIDIQTKEIWFEAKEGKKNSTYAMFTQLLHYVHKALKDGDHIPPFLCVIDSVKAAIMKTQDAMPVLTDKNIKWSKSASQFTQDTLEAVSDYIGTRFVSFRIDQHGEEFINTVKNAIAKGEIIRTQITPDNLKQVFDKWVSMIGKEIRNVVLDQYNLLFFADIMSDGVVSSFENLSAELIHRNGKPSFLIDGKLYELGNYEGYRQFWTIYDRPPKEEYRKYLLERRDILIALDERSFKGAFYTPLNIVDRAYDYLTQTLGNNWQKDYIVWDMCCGVGNLETKHSNLRNVYMSTIDQSDVDIMKATKTCIRAERFQYDYLNDDIADDGNIDYNLTNKIPQGLRKAIENSKNGGKKILVLINPPYGEATSSDNAQKGTKANASKTGIAKTKFAEKGMSEYGKASNELFLQFVARIAKEIPTATLAMFSTLKYVNSQTSEAFRSVWNGKFLNGFVFYSRMFDGLRGEFPIGFLIWKTDNRENAKKNIIDEIQCDILNTNANPVGNKTFYNLPISTYLTNWIPRTKSNKQECIPLKNAITPATATKDLRGNKWSDGAIGFFWCNSNDMQQASTRTALFSSGFNGGHGFFVTKENLWQVAVVFTVRKIIIHTWLNHQDQFLQPTEELSDEFKNDCLIWMLFHDKNLTASADNLEWNGKKWSITNHFIPFTEDEVNAPDRFESDFMVQYMEGKTFSNEAKAVLDEGRKIWQAYFSITDEYDIRNKFKLERPDVGWYQINQALKMRNANGNYKPVSFDSFNKAYKTLSDKLRPMVYSLGFLKQ